MCCNLCACEHDVRMYACLCRSICKGVLEALAFCHQRGVAHGSLGPGSILLNTFRDKQSRDLIVKLDNLGFAQLHRTGVPSELLSLLTPLISAQPCMHFRAFLLGGDAALNQNLLPALHLGSVQMCASLSWLGGIHDHTGL